MAKYRVLVIDDSPSTRMMISKSLQKEPELFELCGEAEDGHVGVRMYRELSPDLVTLDIHMDMMDGLEALREIMKINPVAKVVIISSETRQEILRFISEGASDFIEKPATLESILETLKRAAGHVF